MGRGRAEGRGRNRRVGLGGGRRDMGWRRRRKSRGLSACVKPSLSATSLSDFDCGTLGGVGPKSE